MSHGERDRTRRNAGAFLGPDIMVPVPMRTLSDDYDDHPVDPEDDRLPEPREPGRLTRALNRLFGRSRGSR